MTVSNLCRPQPWSGPPMSKGGRAWLNRVASIANEEVYLKKLI